MIKENKNSVKEKVRLDIQNIMQKYKDNLCEYLMTLSKEEIEKLIYLDKCLRPIQSGGVLAYDFLGFCTHILQDKKNNSNALLEYKIYVPNMM